MSDTGNMQISHDTFMASFMLLLNLLLVDGKKDVSNNCQKIINAVLNKEMDAVKEGALIKQVFVLLDTYNGLLKTNNINIFNLREKKNGKIVKKTIIPGIDIGATFSILSNDRQQLVWTYLKSLYVSSVRMINMANNENITSLSTQNIITEIESSLDIKKILADFWVAYPNSQIIIKKEFDPYIGVGTNNTDYGLNEMLSGPTLLPDQSAPPSLTGPDGISNVVKMMGIDKMIPMEELSKQLKNMTPEDIELASQGIKKMLGEDADEGTTEMIDSMLHNISSELKKEDINNGDPMANMVKIANSVAQNMIPNIDHNKVDMKKMWNQTKKMTNNCVDKNGNPMFAGKNNPLDMMTAFMEKQMNMMDPNINNKSEKQMTEEELMNDCKKMMADMGMPNISPMDLKNIPIDQLMADLDMNKLKNKNVSNIDDTASTKSSKSTRSKARK